MRYSITYPALKEPTSNETIFCNVEDDLLEILRRCPMQVPRLFNGFFVLSYTGPTLQLFTWPVDALGNPDESSVRVYDEKDFVDGNQQVFAHSQSFLKGIKKESRHEYVFSYTYRLQERDGRFKSIYQKGSYVTDPLTGLSMFSTGIFMDITHLTDEPMMLHIIDRVQTENGVEKLVNVSTNYFYSSIYHTLVTRREKEVIKLMTEGLSSKEIAARLFVAESTIINHRKNLLKKTKAKNVAELINIMIKNKVV